MDERNGLVNWRMRYSPCGRGIHHPLRAAGLEIVKAGYSKATGLREIAEYLGLELGEIMAVGDNENDNEFLQIAGIGVAVANAEPDAANNGQTCDRGGRRGRGCGGNYAILCLTVIGKRQLQ